MRLIQRESEADTHTHTEVAEGAGMHLPSAARTKRQSSGCSPAQLSNGNGSHDVRDGQGLLLVMVML